ncbi:PDR/VanB family oxidoreductase [Actinomycetospora termitidis]|uniref:PDR/VanB family oxidoreductase n=1 Tax=Actinomycetospora termitidis TaxID=3053470 RepID=A0ABT7M4Y4_9PSEU|nr:PDR/VanB family oxidoreductase [Actinomycetospora sp. Odt1-22]MDL5154832.1 PDR/VanB family oxidoreductase [Actinomycetospora sp. Odt1-22]
MTSLVVTARDDVAEGVVALTLARPDGGRLPDWTPGAHVDLTLGSGDTRTYSLCGDRRDPSSYRVAVLREPAGRGGSSYVHDVLRVGDRIGLGGPRNHFPLVPAARYRFVAGGIGITPLLPMMTAADVLGAEWALLYGGRRRASMAFLDELRADRTTVVPQDEQGLLPLAAWLGPVDPDTIVYACGPAPLLAAVAELVPAARLRTELFVAAELAAPVRDTPFTVELARAGATVTVDAGTSVLDAARRAGATTLSSCERGTCGTCETTVLAGVPDHRDQILADHERAAGDVMLPCVSRAASDHLVLDL